MVNIKLDGMQTKLNEKYISLFTLWVDFANPFFLAVFPKGEDLPVYVCDFRKWKIFPNRKVTVNDKVKILIIKLILKNSSNHKSRDLFKQF